MNTELKIREKYNKRYLLKNLGKPFPSRLIAYRTLGTAIHVLSIIENVPYDELVHSIYIWCKDSKLTWFTRVFESLIELAGANPERFVFSLHKTYNDLAVKIRKQNLYSAVVELCGAYARLGYTEIEGVNGDVVLAYTQLLFQVSEYLRPDKFNFTRCLIGVTTSGSPLYANQFNPDSDKHIMEYEEKLAQRLPVDHHKLVSLIYSTNMSSLSQSIPAIVAAKSNPIVVTEMFSQIERLNDTTRMSMFPYINEFTYDMYPHNTYQSPEPPISELRINVQVDELKQVLSSRNKALPANGVLVKVDDPTGELKSVQYKEVVKDDEVVMLYRICTSTGDISGFYCTKSGFLFAPSMFIRTKENKTDGIESLKDYDNSSAFILYCYAHCTVDSVTHENITISNRRKPVTLQFYNIGGKLKNTVPTEERQMGTARIGSEDYVTETKSINPYIRKLPAGKSISDEAARAAESMGYNLAPGFTFVKPFCKSVFVRKDKKESDIKKRYS